jgi:hypothetical protein
MVPTAKQHAVPPIIVINKPEIGCSSGTCFIIILEIDVIGIIESFTNKVESSLKNNFPLKVELFFE